MYKLLASKIYLSAFDMKKAACERLWKSELKKGLVPNGKNILFSCPFFHFKGGTREKSLGLGTASI